MLVLMDEEFYNNNELLSGARQALLAGLPSIARAGRLCRRPKEFGAIACLQGSWRLRT